MSTLDDSSIISDSSPADSLSPFEKLEDFSNPARIRQLAAGIKTDISRATKVLSPEGTKYARLVAEEQEISATEAVAELLIQHKLFKELAVFLGLQQTDSFQRNNPDGFAVITVSGSIIIGGPLLNSTSRRGIKYIKLPSRSRAREKDITHVGELILDLQKGSAVMIEPVFRSTPASTILVIPTDRTKEVEQALTASFQTLQTEMQKK